MAVSDDELAAMLAEELFERRAKVLFLYTGGATFTQIAKVCEISTTTARKDLDIARRAVLNETPEQRKARQLATCRDITRANYAAMMSGNDKAAEKILKAMNHEAALIGLYSPAKVLTGVSSVDFANDAARLIAAINATDPDAFQELNRGQTGLPAGALSRHMVIDAETVDLAPDSRADGAVGDDRPPQHDQCPPAPEEPADDDDDGWSNIGD